MLLAFFAALAVMVTLGYARPTLESRNHVERRVRDAVALRSLLGMMLSWCSANNFVVLYLGLEIHER